MTAAAPDAPTPAAPDTPERDVKMTIWEHLDELRGRVVRAAIGVFAGTIVAWVFRVEILAWLIIPYQRVWTQRFHKELLLQTLAPADAFLGYLEQSLTTGIIASAPIIFYQLWSFISPGLYKKEKRLIVPFVFFSSVLFLSGVAFAYYVAFPFTFNYFLSLLGEVRQGVELTQIVTLEFFLDFATRFLLAFGAVFELPLFISFLAIAGIVTPQQLVKAGRWAILGSFILGAVASPGPEVTSMLAVSCALVVLYFLSVAVAFLVAKKPAAATPPK